MKIHNCKFISANRITKKDLTINYSDTYLNFNKDENNFIDQSWKKTLRDNPHANIFNGNLFRLSSYNITDGNIIKLILTNTDYKEYIGTRNKSFSMKFHNSLIADPLAACIALISSDNYIILEKRENKDVHSGHYHVIGGFMDRDNDFKNEKPDPFLTMEREVNEELGIDIFNKIKYISGIVYDDLTPHPEICFQYSMNEKLEDILNSISTKKINEVNNVFGLENSPDMVFSFIKENINMLSTTGLGCLALHGKSEFGVSWFNSVIANFE